LFYYYFERLLLIIWGIRHSGSQKNEEKGHPRVDWQHYRLYWIELRNGTKADARRTSMEKTPSRPQPTRSIDGGKKRKGRGEGREREEEKKKKKKKKRKRKRKKKKKNLRNKDFRFRTVAPLDERKKRIAGLPASF